MSVLVKVLSSAPDARMHYLAAERFEKLRDDTLIGSGVDFLARCGDIFRPADYVSGKDGVANRSWHKTGRAFDYDQTNRSLVVASEVKAGKQYFRTYLFCRKQDGSEGFKKVVRDYRGGSASGYLFDFTAAAAAAGFDRIPAWRGWQDHYNRQEFWHYQFTQGLTWNAAMLQLRGKAGTQIIGLNDRDSNTGGMVRKIQTKLTAVGVLPKSEIDGVFGPITRNAVQAFQRLKGLDADGLVGPKTQAALGV